MSNLYRATVNVQAPLTNIDQNWISDTFAAMAAEVDAHMILEWSTWNPTGTPGLYVVTFRYQAAGDAEAVSIIHDAAKAAGTAYDAVSVKARATHGYNREVVAV